LDVSRVTRGLVSIDQQAVEIDAVIKSAIEQAQPLIDSRKHALALDLRSSGAVVLGDKKRLVQVIANLLTNAAKYTPLGGRIALSVETQGEQLVLAVSDNGI
ncbi:sensor histidine kinase, partial [Massilia sp. UBA6681]|uniref:sensor histidine kinase n=1 Tax=Massilia sp. UBA6681 TaxID=1946839 RepID=UPI0025C0EFA9